MRRSAACGQPERAGKKRAEAIQREVAREVEQLLRTIFTGLRKTGHVDLEAIEMLVRSAMHQAEATVLTELLQFSRAGRANHCVPVQPTDALSRIALEDSADRGRCGGSLPALVSLCALSSRAVSGR